MKKLALAALLAAAPVALLAEPIEPGEWEFTSTTQSPMLPKPQVMTARKCLTQEDADNPDRWMRPRTGQGECQFTYGEKSSDTVSWKMSCPKSNMTGSGTGRVRRNTMETDVQIAGEAQGRKFEMRARMTGRRVGPCKS
jgi:hypothetical protein